jgi:diguanylate cyclase (GGDEF)-like protein
MEQQEKELLIKRAYTDDLTQINNRRFCSEYMDKLQSAKSEKYSIISLDVNNLKQINDTYGHSKGDILIKKAANLISRAFNQTGIVGRMGGDEFIVILPINDKHKIDTLIISFKNILDEANLNTDDMHISIAYGYATSNDVEENNVETVYKLADIRMYEHKKSIKKKMHKVS